MLEVDLDLVVAVDISQYLVADDVGGKLVVVGDQADAHMAMFSILLGFQSKHQKPGAVLLMSLLKNDVTGLFVDNPITGCIFWTCHLRAFAVHHRLDLQCEDNGLGAFFCDRDVEHDVFEDLQVFGSIQTGVRLHQHVVFA